MKYKALTTFLHDQLGKVHMGEEVEMNDLQAQTPIMFGWVEAAEQKPAEVQLQTPAAEAPTRRSRRSKDTD